MNGCPMDSELVDLTLEEGSLLISCRNLSSVLHSPNNEYTNKVGRLKTSFLPQVKRKFLLPGGCFTKILHVIRT